jgi:hypothetical protein
MNADVRAANELFSTLRRLAAERPQDARARVAQLLDERPPGLSRLLVQIGAPGEGRLRHIIANSIRVKIERADAVPQLGDWFALETDEFTKNALRLALEARRAHQPPTSGKAAIHPVNEYFVEAYRYAASRLSHRVRNALIEPQTALLKLEPILLEMEDPALRARFLRIVGQLESGFQRVSRLVEFDVEDEYFRMRHIAIRDWLVLMNEKYARNYSPVGLKIDAEEATLHARVHASEHLLNTIFWNIWVNAHQVVGEACQITVRIAARASSLCLTILDNGDGFLPEAKDAAFFHAYSGAPSRSGHSGKGLLEVQDAVARLHGKVELVEAEDHWRMLIRFPQEPT